MPRDEQRKALRFLLEQRTVLRLRGTARSRADAARGSRHCQIAACSPRSAPTAPTAACSSAEPVDRWFAAPGDVPRGVLQPNTDPADVAPGCGDSFLVECAGFGASVLPTAPAFGPVIGASLADGLRFAEGAYRISLGEHPHYRIPALDFRGIPVGVDARKVIESKTLPVIDIMMVHRKPGLGLVGMGTVEPADAVLRGRRERSWMDCKANVRRCEMKRRLGSLLTAAVLAAAFATTGVMLGGAGANEQGSYRRRAAAERTIRARRPERQTRLRSRGRRHQQRRAVSRRSAAPRSSLSTPTIRASRTWPSARPSASSSRKTSLRSWAPGTARRTVAGTQAAERHRTPWIIEVASADVILERGFKYVSRVNVKASWYGEAPVDYLDYVKSKLGQKVETVAIMYTDDDWGRSSVGKGTKDALLKRGYQIIEEIAYPSATQDVTTYINKIKAARPDALGRSPRSPMTRCWSVVRSSN